MATEDWDGESYCISPGCKQPATHRVLETMEGDAPVYLLVCCLHARRDDDVGLE